MLSIVVPSLEGFDETKQEFVQMEPEVPITLEHSLIAISKWESKWHKPFLSDGQKTDEEILDYVRCMTITQNVKPEVYKRLSDENILEINKYIADSMTATWINEVQKDQNHSRPMTSELIYYYMVVHGIPFTCEKWHLNRLIMLIRVANAESQAQKPMSKKDALARQRAINKANRAKFNSKG